MTLVRRAMLFCAAGLLAASAAMAGVPSAGTSTQPASGSVLKLIGHTAVADPLGNVSWTIRDASSNVVPGSVVILNTSACTDVHLCLVNQNAGFNANCGSKTITGVTNGVGQVTFSVVGASGSGAPVFAAAAPCIAVTADGVALNSLKAATADENGSGGVGGLDIGQVFFDQVTGGGVPATARARSDFDGSGTVTGLDIGQVFLIQVSLGSTSSCDPPATNLCP